MNENEETLDELSQLKKELSPPPHLEGRIVSALQSKGLLRRRTAGWLKAVAAIFIFSLGLGCGKFIWRSAPEQYTHILLLREDAAHFKEGHDASLVREYTDWARRLRNSGVNITGERLATSRILLPDARDNQSGGVIAGFFLITAKSDEIAFKESQSCPHLRHGGTIELRRIDTASP